MFTLERDIFYVKLLYSSSHNHTLVFVERNDVEFYIVLSLGDFAYFFTVNVHCDTSKVI